jgi:hypothetical protein
VDLSGREYLWLQRRLREVEADLAVNPYDLSLIKEKVAIAKEMRLRTVKVVAVCDGEEVEQGRWRTEEDCRRSVEQRGLALDKEYAVTGSDKPVKFVTKPAQ